MNILELAQSVLDAARARGWTIASAESCTGGMVAAQLTAVAGSSDVIGFGFVTYSNQAKEILLGVPRATLQTFGAVSVETAQAMAEGALARSGADLAVSVTGIAGPGGAVPGKPVGTVCFALASRHGEPAFSREHFGGARSEIREASTRYALEMLLSGCSQSASRKGGTTSLALRGAR